MATMREKAIEIATRHARAHEGEYAYLNARENPVWQPHSWVVDSIEEALAAADRSGPTHAECVTKFDKFDTSIAAALDRVHRLRNEFAATFGGVKPAEVEVVIRQHPELIKALQSSGWVVLAGVAAAFQSAIAAGVVPPSTAPDGELRAAKEVHGVEVVSGPGWVVLGCAIEQIQKGARIQLQPSTGNVSTVITDDVALAMESAARMFGGTDGTFNAAGFSTALSQLAGTSGPIDGNVVSAILRGRTDVVVLHGGAHFRIVERP